MNSPSPIVGKRGFLVLFVGCSYSNYVRQIIIRRIKIVFIIVRVTVSCCRREEDVTLGIDSIIKGLRVTTPSPAIICCYNINSTGFHFPDIFQTFNSIGNRS